MSASGVLASLRVLTVPQGYDSPLRSLRPCWTAILRILRIGVDAKSGVASNATYDATIECFRNVVRG